MWLGKTVLQKTSGRKDQNHRRRLRERLNPLDLSVMRHLTLFWRGQPLKHYKAEAPNQEAIVRAFQGKHWQKYVTVSLPQEFEVNTKIRLHDAIKHLNRAL